ncbi:MAG: FIST N-terminal domain-containing protein [Maribacter sp.]
MKIEQAIKTANEPFVFKNERMLLKNPLVLVFGDRFLLEEEGLLDDVKIIYPNGHFVFGSTSGEIIGATVLDNSLTITAIEFEKAQFLVKRENVKDFENNDFGLGKSLLSQFPKENLTNIFLVSEGSFVNGSSLISGLKEENQDINISGGLCGDGDRFQKTLCSYNEQPKEGEVVAIGFYGNSLEISSASFGGWSTFGPERSVTKSKGNILFELDGKPALDLYKKYLGEKSKDLPKSALLYPLNVCVDDQQAIVRTILNINDEKNTMMLAGDIPEGSKVQLMMSTVDDIAEAASKAAKLAMENRVHKPELAILISCVGRKLVMGQRTEEEIEEVVSVIGEDAVVTGFYSYGEMAPFSGQESCRLHNQTMTLTLISE